MLPRVFGAKDIHDEWISKAVKVAVAQRNYSLVESLIWRLKADANNYPDLMALANEMRENSLAIAKAMNASLV